MGVYFVYESRKSLCRLNKTADDILMYVCYSSQNTGQGYSLLETIDIWFRLSSLEPDYKFHIYECHFLSTPLILRLLIYDTM